MGMHPSHKRTPADTVTTLEFSEFAFTLLKVWGVGIVLFLLLVGTLSVV